MLTQIYVAIWRHQATTEWSEGEIHMYIDRFEIEAKVAPKSDYEWICYMSNRLQH